MNAELLMFIYVKIMMKFWIVILGIGFLTTILFIAGFIVVQKYFGINITPENAVSVFSGTLCSFAAVYTLFVIIYTASFDRNERKKKEKLEQQEIERPRYSKFRHMFDN